MANQREKVAKFIAVWETGERDGSEDWAVVQWPDGEYEVICNNETEDRVLWCKTMVQDRVDNFQRLKDGERGE